MIWLLSFNVLWTSLFITFANAQQCVTPDEGSGECKPIRECPQLLSMVGLARTNETVKSYLQRSLTPCGFNADRQPTVCCSDCRTPENKSGRCIGLYSCPHLLDMLRKPTAENKMYVNASKCDSAAQYSVCCGPPRQLITPVPVSKFKVDCENEVFIFPPDKDTKCCGRDSSGGTGRIAGGNHTNIDEYPWLVLIEHEKDGQIKLMCGGSLISSKYVLTAGHCVDEASRKHGIAKNIRLGEYDISNNGADCIRVSGGGKDCNEDPIVIPIGEIIVHPSYFPQQSLQNDIALIKMRSTSPYTDFIRPICLPTTDLTLNSRNNFIGYAAGWGAVSTEQNKSNSKLHVGLPIVPLETCQSIYRGRVQLWRGQLCAGGQAGKDSCKGDSGGPLMFPNGLIYDLLGVISFGPRPCGSENVPGVYTNVFEYRDWIMSTIKERQ